MNITLQLSSEKELELKRRAAEAGCDVAGYVLDALQRQLEADEGDNTLHRRPYEEWSREFNAWIKSHPSRNPDFDDSRDRIYDRDFIRYQMISTIHPNDVTESAETPA